MNIAAPGTVSDSIARVAQERANEAGGRLGRAAESVEAGADPKKLKALKQATQEFEGLFVTMLLESMRKTIVKSGLMSGGRGEEVFQQLQDLELSRGIGKRGGLGIGEMVYRHLAKHAAAEEKAREPAPAGASVDVQG
ncbi:MAG: rod-binding protein [Planctomycetes bacterium]|nr:rod-binding protein [Planctomycetota bacterium]